MKILRIETYDGCGPFTKNANGVNRAMPTPVEDGIPKQVIPGRFCGVKEFNHLFNWFDLEAMKFPPWWTLNDHEKYPDFGLAEYEANDVIEGYTQVMFDKNSAVRLCWIPLKEIC